MIDPSTTKYLIRAKISTEGIVEKPDVVGAIFGQTEGLLGEELDLRDLQKSGRVGRIEVEIEAKKGKVEGYVIVPSSLDQVETAILAAALETIDRVGPCKAKIEVERIEDVRITKRARIVERAKELLAKMIEEAKTEEIFKSPLHPYTKYLIGSLPKIGDKSYRVSAPGSPPPLSSLPPGCSFHPRCPHVTERCKKEIPSLVEVGDSHKVACFLVSKEVQQ